MRVSGAVWINEGFLQLDWRSIFPFLSPSIVVTHIHPIHPLTPIRLKIQPKVEEGWRKRCNKEVKFIRSESINTNQLTNLAVKNVWIMFACAKVIIIIIPYTRHSAHSAHTQNWFLMALPARVKGVNHQINYNIFAMSSHSLSRSLLSC